MSPIQFRAIIDGSFQAIEELERQGLVRIHTDLGLIRGKHVFRVAGYNMVLEDVGATVYLTDKNGVTYEVVVDEVISKQLFKSHTAALLQAS